VTAASLRLVNATDCDIAFSFGLDLTRYDRRLSLTGPEVAALTALGTDGLRRSRARGATRDEASWSALARLVGPLDDAAATLHHHDCGLARQAAADAAALVLGRCASVDRSWWSWTPADWRELLGGNAMLFRAAVPWPASTMVRPFVIALAYLLGEFDDFHTIGTFDRLYLARLVFGPPLVDDTLAEVAALLGSWGYRGHDGAGRPLPGAFSQFLLLNRSPLMKDLNTEAFVRLREHPSLLSTHYRRVLFGLQRAAAASGHCDPPVRFGSYHMENLDGVDPAWAGWVERWHATSTLTPRVRSITRCIMAKAGRWLAAEHPDITEPGQWTRATCAAWVAAVDRMKVGDYDSPEPACMSSP